MQDTRNGKPGFPPGYKPLTIEPKFPVCNTLTDLIRLQPNLIRISIPRPPFDSPIFRAYPIAHYPRDYDDNSNFHFVAGPRFSRDLNDANYTPTEKQYYVDWSRPNPPPTEFDLKNIIIQRYPEMTSRAEKAVAIIRLNLVTPVADHTFDVNGSYFEDIYRVRIPPDRTNWSCTRIASHKALPPATCPDIENNAPYLKHGKRCKHMVAAWMFQTIRERLRFP